MSFNTQKPILQGIHQSLKHVTFLRSLLCMHHVPIELVCNCNYYLGSNSTISIFLHCSNSIKWDQKIPLSQSTFSTDFVAAFVSVSELW
jgi:hypothetical protein